MPHLYSHKRHGWQILYRVYFPDGTYIKKTKYRKRKQEAWDIFHDTDKLEVASRKRAITKEECIFARNIGLITADEAGRLIGSHVSPYRTWNELIKQYELWAHSHYRPYTYYTMCHSMYLATNQLSHISPAELTKEHLLEYITKRKITVKASTIDKEIIALRKLLDFLDPNNNPAREIKLLKIKDERLPRPLSLTEIERFLESLDKNQHLLRGYIKPLVLIYLYAGLRPSEIVSLTPADIDLNANKIYIQAKDNYQTKTGRARSVVIHPKLRPYLENISKKYVIGGESPFNPKVVSYAITKVIKRAGLRDITPYCLRHSFVTYLLQAGATIREIMDLVGHSQLSTVLRYLHVVPDKNSPILKLDFDSKKDSG